MKGKDNRLAARWAPLLVLLLPVLLMIAPGVRAAPASSTGPTIGVVVQDTPFSRLEQLGLGHGVTVAAVMRGSPVEKAGIAPGDILVSLDGLPIYSSARLHWLVSQQKEGKTLSLRVHREGSPPAEGTDIDVVLEPFTPTPVDRASAGEENGRAWLGVRMQPMTEALRTAYGVPQGQGVLVTDVIRDSPAAKAGVRAGDVIVRIDRRNIRSTGDIYRAIDFFDPGESVEIAIVRDRDQRELSATLGTLEPAPGGFYRGPYRRRGLGELPWPWPSPLPPDWRGLIEESRRSPWRLPPEEWPWGGYISPSPPEGSEIAL